MAKLALGTLLVSSLFTPTPVAAQDVQPGDVFREYVWRPTRNWARCTGEDAKDAGAKQFLPNPINYIDLKDLKDATRVEVIVEKLLSHAGTNLPRVRVNKNAWIAIPTPDPKVIPGSIGEGGRNPYWYLTMRYPAISIPMNQLRQGSNSFEFKCTAQGGDDLGRIWPQFIYYGVTFRVYYKSTKPHPVGLITAPRPGSSLGAKNASSIQFEATVAHFSGTVDKVDFIGNYNDFDWRGNGIEEQYKFNMLYGKIRHHIGTGKVNGNKATVNWDASWIPEQDNGFSVLARITDTTGMTYVTQPVDGLELRRPFTIKRYRNQWIARKWQSRYHTPTHSCYTTVNDDLSKATDARIYMGTWNGYEAEGIGLNGRQMIYNIGKNHDLSYDHFKIPVANIVRGKNTMYTYSRTLHHGIEVQWPGMELFVRYNVPETTGKVATYGTACAGSNGAPTITSGSRPIIGRSFSVGLTKAKPNTGAGLLVGLSNTTWGSFELPLPLGNIGAPGCLLLNSAELTGSTTTNGSGTAGFIIPVPNNRSFLGAHLFHQWVVFDSVNAMKAVFSNAMRTTVGDR